MMRLFALTLIVVLTAIAPGVMGENLHSTKIGSQLQAESWPSPLDPALSHSLAGFWQFRPGDELAWASPSFDDSTWRSMQVPKRWPEGGFPETSQHAWYRITLQFDTSASSYSEHIAHLGLRMGKVSSAYEAYAGGRKIGSMGSLPPLADINYDRMQVLRIPADALDTEGRLVLALRVWGGGAAQVSAWGGGVYEGSFEIGNYTALSVAQVYDQVPALILALLTMAFGIYHLYLFHRNPQLSAYLWLGAMSVGVSVYGVMLSQWKYELGLPFLGLEKIEFAVLYLLPVLGIQVIWSLLDLPIQNLLRGYQASCLVLAIVVSVVPGFQIHYSTLGPWQLATLPLLVAAPVLVAYMARQGNAEATTLLGGLVVFAAACINDILIDQAYTSSARLAPLGFVAVLASMGVSLANHISRMLNHLEVQVHERTEALREANEQLNERAKTDSLTGLFNRRGFVDRVEREIRRASRTQRGFSLVLADIDNFKQFNDQYGHACGDHVLKRVADLFQHTLRDIDQVGRWGGEEFAFLLPETDDVGAAVLSEKLRETIEENVYEYEGIRLKVTMTFGVARHRSGESIDGCLLRADQALYRGKDRGRNCVSLAGKASLQVVT